MDTDPAMNHWHAFAIGTVIYLITLGIVYRWGYRNGRLDEYREWGTRKKEDAV